MYFRVACGVFEREGHPDDNLRRAAKRKTALLSLPRAPRYRLLLLGFNKGPHLLLLSGQAQNQDFLESAPYGAF